MSSFWIELIQILKKIKGLIPTDISLFYIFKKYIIQTNFNILSYQMLNTFIYLLTFIFWTCMGSFMSSYLYRLSLLKKADKEDIYNNFKWRSYCPNCKHTLWIKDLFPILSYAFAWWKCNHCKEKISIRYPIYEICMWIMFMITTFFMYNNLIPFFNHILFIQLFSSLMIIFFFISFLFSFQYNEATAKRAFRISMIGMLLFFSIYSLLVPYTKIALWVF